MRLARWLPTIVGVWLAGCGHTTGFTPTNLPPHEMKARPEASVELFTTQPPTKPFVEVGLLTSTHSSTWSSSTDEEVLLGLRTKAAEVGCDAVVVTSETNQLSGYVASSGDVSARNFKRFRAACVMWKGDAQ